MSCVRHPVRCSKQKPTVVAEQGRRAEAQAQQPPSRFPKVNLQLTALVQRTRSAEIPSHSPLLPRELGCDCIPQSCLQQLLTEQTRTLFFCFSWEQTTSTIAEVKRSATVCVVHKLPLILAVLSGVFSFGCQDLEEAPHCAGSLPASACPTNRGGTCDDQTCSSIYRCAFDGWVKEKDCDRSDAAADASDAGGDTADAFVCEAQAPLEASTGCTPPLYQGECPVEVALICSENACSTGCFDFFVCHATGWDLAAYCDDTTNKLMWVDGF